MKGGGLFEPRPPPTAQRQLFLSKQVYRPHRFPVKLGGPPARNFQSQSNKHMNTNGDEKKKKNNNKKKKKHTEWASKTCMLVTA